MTQISQLNFNHRVSPNLVGFQDNIPLIADQFRNADYSTLVNLTSIQ